MLSDIIQIIQSKAKEYLAIIIDIRHHLHKNPELSFAEEKTADFISDQLTKMDIPHTRGWGGHGIVAMIHGKQGGNTIALRADMDALPIKEANQVSYASQNKGVMHACGHDVHMSSLLGVAMILNEMKDTFKGDIKLIFQPGEEKLPGGASILIKEGVLKSPAPLCIIGQHVFPSLEVGKVGIRSGLYMASADEIYLTIKGKGGHAAMPQDCTDTILAASQIIVSLQQIVARKNHPTIPSVLSFGKINSVGGATNIIPDVVKIEGTFRTMDETWRSRAHELITNTILMTAAAYDVECDVNIMKGYPCLVNEPILSAHIHKAMKLYLGDENVVELPVRMTSEDFSFYSQEIPACFYRLGTGNVSKGITSAVHTPTFDIDENALEVGMGLMAYLALQELMSHQNESL